MLHTFQKEESKIAMKWELNMVMGKLKVRYSVPLLPLSKFHISHDHRSSLGLWENVYHKENVRRDCSSE